ncbi:hypothetical protein Bca101_095906 [Brassica carinata]
MLVSRGEQMCGSMHQYCKLPTQTHPEDVQNISANPRLIYQLKTRAQKCSVCKVYRASKVVLDDKWGNENQCYYCDICFGHMHNEKDLLYCDVLVFEIKLN